MLFFLELKGLDPIKFNNIHINKLECRGKVHLFQ